MSAGPGGGGAAPRGAVGGSRGRRRRARGQRPPCSPSGPGGDGEGAARGPPASRSPPPSLPAGAARQNPPSPPRGLPGSGVGAGGARVPAGGRLPRGSALSRGLPRGSGPSAGEALQKLPPRGWRHRPHALGAASLLPGGSRRGPAPQGSGGCGQGAAGAAPGAAPRGFGALRGALGVLNAAVPAAGLCCKDWAAEAQRGSDPRLFKVCSPGCVGKRRSEPSLLPACFQQVHDFIKARLDGAGGSRWAVPAPSLPCVPATRQTSMGQALGTALQGR